MEDGMQNLDTSTHSEKRVSTDTGVSLYLTICYL